MKRTWPIILIALILTGLSALSWRAVLAAPPAQGDLALITSPQNNAIVRGVVTIQGSATHPQFQFYKVEVAREPVSDENFAIIGAIREEQVVDGQLELWDTTQVPDGSYTLRLRVVRLDGNYSEYSTVQVVVANAQPTETPTPAAAPAPTISPTPLPPTPTIVIDQPALPTSAVILPPTPVTPLPTPVEEEASFSLDTTPLQTACLYGAGISLGVFLLFGFMAALRNLIYALIGRR